MAEVTQEQIVEYIKGISVMELSQLVKALEEELGVSAAAMPVAMAGAVAAPGAAAAEEQRRAAVAQSPCDTGKQPDQPGGVQQRNLAQGNEGSREDQRTGHRGDRIS